MTVAWPGSKAIKISITACCRHSQAVALEFLAQSNEEQGHAEYVEATTLPDMIKEDLVAECIAVDVCRGFSQFLGDRDPTTRRMLESILEVEEAHADDLADLLPAVLVA